MLKHLLSSFPICLFAEFAFASKLLIVTVTLWIYLFIDAET